MQPHAIEPSFAGLDDRIFMDVIHGGDAAQRIALAAQLAAFLGREDAPRKERDQVIPAVLKLTADPVEEVRQALALGLIGIADLNADVLFSIISDDDEIALPFLSLTPALSHWHMLAVLRVGDEARRAAVALRPDISPEAVDYIVESLPLAINVLMFDNESIAPTAEQFHRLYQRFGESREMLDCLLARDDLPLDIRIAQARRAAARMQQLIVERGWIPANDAAELVADAEETAVLNILTGAGPDQLSSVVAYLVNGELLTPSIIVRAACLGAMDVVAQTLAALADMPLKRVQETMFAKPQGAFRSLHAKCGLPQGCYWTLQAACDAAREEREDGLRLTPEDFGRRMIELLMTRYESLPMAERPRQLDYVGRFAADRVRLIARRLKADLLRAA
jgi:uncharacterized protein (DUF2336 family)